MQPIYKGQRLMINGEFGQITSIIKPEKGSYFWGVFNQDNGHTEVYQFTNNKYKLKENK